jgi:CDP-glucose 4,6-dehydratase
MVNLKDMLSQYKGKKVLVTGHTGFKGSWLCIWLKELGADVIGYSLDPYTADDNFVQSRIGSKMVDLRGDVRDYTRLHRVFEEYSPEIVFHLAAQSLVFDGYTSPKDTYDVNVSGTVNVLECCRSMQSVSLAVIVTSDKCYENKERTWGYQEDDTLGGDDPYSSSKACAELVTHAYRKSFFNVVDVTNHTVALSSARAGNVIGGGDWRAYRIVPDCIRAFEKGEKLLLRHPRAVRPWQFVLEPLGGYLLLVAKMMTDRDTFSGAWNFGPDMSEMVTVQELVTIVAHYYGRGDWQKDVTNRQSKETHFLTLDSTRAVQLLGWNRLYPLRKAVLETVEWYKQYKTESDMYALCAKQIHDYMQTWSDHEDS